MRIDSSLKQTLKTVLISSIVTVTILVWYEILGRIVFIIIIVISLLAILFG